MKFDRNILNHICYLWALMAVLAMNSCNISDSKNPKDENYLKEYGLFVNRITSFQRDAEQRVHWERDSICIDSWMLNTDKYIRLFDKLKIENGYNIYLNYVWSGSAGYPVILSLQDSVSLDSLIKTFIYKDSLGFLISDQSYNFYDDVHWNYIDSIREKYLPEKHLKAEDSKIGYFQLLCFYLISSDFAKYWHANYSQREILTSRPRLNEILAYYEDYTEKENIAAFEKEKQKAIGIDSLITINFTQDSCFLKVTVAQRSLMDENGIYRVKWSISRQFPHEISLSSFELLVKDPVRIIY